MNPANLRARDLVWRGDRLCLGRKMIVDIVPDAVWSGMWRVRADGKLSDMVNRARAKDAALAIALSVLNRAPPPASTEASGESIPRVAA
jgi:hypothetical protein